MWEVVMKYAGQHKLKHQIGFLMNYRAKDKSESPEEYWRNARYDWLFRTARGNPLITAQHLGDAVEGWIFSCLHGNPKLINYKRDNLYRPFLTTMKSDLVAWSVKNGVEWLEDASNQDTNFPRNRIRNEMMEQCLKINPGIHKTIKKKILNQLELSVVAT
jgi:tRNA(Ile)-lysidine synthase